MPTYRLKRKLPQLHLVDMPLSPVQLLDLIAPQRLGDESLLDTAARLLVAEALWLHKGHHGNAAEYLGISPKQLSYRLDGFERFMDELRAVEQRIEGTNGEAVDGRIHEVGSADA